MLQQNRLLASLKRFSTSANLRTSNDAGQNRGEYYKNLGQVDQDVKPAGWDTALPFDQIPGPKPIPFFGNMLKFIPKIGDLNVPQQEMQKRLQTQYGNIVRLTGIWGKNDMVLLNNPDDIEIALRNEGAWPERHGMEAIVKYRAEVREEVFQGVGGVLTVHGEEWFNVRTQVNPILMQPKNANLYVQGINDVTDDFIKNIRHFATLNKDHEMPEDFQIEIYKWTLESIALIALDERLGTLNLKHDKNHESFKYITTVLEAFNLLYKLDILPSFYQFYETRNWKKLVKTMDFLTFSNVKHMENSIKKLEASNKNEGTLSILQQLLKKDKKVALAMVMDMMIAGVDTTGKILGATLYFLANNPDKQQILRDELLQHLPEPNTPITTEILKNTPYLKATVKEALRIAPIAVGNVRRAVKDLVIGGYRIPKDTDILGVSIVNANSDDHYVEAKKFIPERWLRTTEGEYSHKNAHPFIYLPFGFGPRSCIGKRLANLELEMGVAKIIRNFKLTWPHPEAEFNSTLLYGIASPLKFHVHPVDK